MGCWNYQILCDDGALDAMDELLESEEVSADIARFLKDAMECEDDYLEYDVCEYGLVAAALVDISVNGVNWDVLNDTPYDEDEEYFHFFQKVMELDLSSLKDDAIKVLDLAVQDVSELRELWEENEDMFPKWLANLETIKKRLKGAK